GPAPTYQWKVNGTDVQGAIGATYINNTYVDNDQVTCDVRSSGTCAGTPGSATVTVHVMATGVKEITGADIQLLPNPNKGAFTLKGTIGITGEATVEVTDMLGQIVYTTNVEANNGMINAQIQPGKNIANGMYIVTLRAGDMHKVFHMVIEK